MVPVSGGRASTGDDIEGAGENGSVMSVPQESSSSHAPSTHIDPGRHGWKSLQGTHSEYSHTAR